MRSRVLRLIGAVLLGALLILPAWAERMQRLGRFEAHYSLIPTLMLSANVAGEYAIARGRDRALLNVSILDPDGKPVQATVTGVVRDLLGQPNPIAFREVLEGDAVYYLAEIRHANQEVLRFAIDVQTPDGASHRFAFQQTMYWEQP